MSKNIVYEVIFMVWRLFLWALDVFDLLMDVSVCIVNFNSIKQLKKCFCTLKSGIYPFSYEVIIVDNFLRMVLKILLEKHFSNVRLISNSRNMGVYLRD